MIDWLSGYLFWGGILTLAEVAFVTFGAVVFSGYCEKCGRSKQWRLKRPNQYANRRYCPFCEQDCLDD